MRINLKNLKKVDGPHAAGTTYEGADAAKITPIQELRRTCLACLLWEDNFYENGMEAQKRVKELCTKVSSEELGGLIFECVQQKLRHMPLKLVVELLKKPNNKAKYIISEVCTRPDQMMELLSLYWKDGKKPLSKQLQRGLAHAFKNFDAYQLAKYNRDNAIKLKDILFLSHAKPQNEKQAIIWKNLIDNKLETPETWETKLSAGENKKEAFSELLEKGKMGSMAILRNLRNMIAAKVDMGLVFRRLEEGRPLLPFEYFRAYKSNTEWADEIEVSMLKHLQIENKLLGTTMIFVDVSGSMNQILSSKSTTTLMDAAGMFAVLLREWCEAGTTVSFSDHHKFISSTRGFKLIDEIKNSQPNSGTNLGSSMLSALKATTNVKIDRLIVITDEQSHDDVPFLAIPNKYFISLGGYKNQLKTDKSWVHITGFSEHVIKYILELERPSFFVHSKVSDDIVDGDV